MLKNCDVSPTIGVRDLEAAKGFYGGVLGLDTVSSNPYEVVYETGNTHLAVYLTDHAGTNEATYATWEVDDIDGEIQTLKGAGVAFEHYDMEGVTLEGDVHLLGNSGEKASWFKDPDGNILCLHQTA